MKLWSQHPEWERVDIEGHADVRGTDEYNQKLSERRANQVKKVLLDLHAPADKLTAAGFGKTRPRVEGRDPESLQKNRRVELVVIRKRPADENGPGKAPAGEGTTAPLPIAPNTGKATEQPVEKAPPKAADKAAKPATKEAP